MRQGHVIELFSAFLHCYVQSGDPCLSLRKAMEFASYKIGMASAAGGFLDEPGLDEWVNNLTNAT